MSRVFTVGVSGDMRALKVFKVVRAFNTLRVFHVLRVVGSLGCSAWVQGVYGAYDVQGVCRAYEV